MTSSLRIFIILALLSFMFSIFGFGQQRPCTQADGKHALDEADSLRAWDTLYKSYRSYRACDDGAIAEGYSESVIRILVDHWGTLPQLEMLVKQDAEFRSFVMRHVNATLNANDVALVKRKAKTKCPAGLNHLCVELAKQADSVLKDAASP